MQASERITAAISAANDGGRTAVIPFIPCDVRALNPTD